MNNHLGIGVIISALLASSAGALHIRVDGKMVHSTRPSLGVTEVPDPYYGGINGFERVLDMVEAASEGLLEHIRKSHL